MTTSTLVNTIQDLGPRPSSTPAIEHYRPLGDLTQLVPSKPGHFWCYTHLADLPLEKQSPDPRYCQQCFEILVKEAKDTGRSKGRVWWVPVARGSGASGVGGVADGVTQVYPSKDSPPPVVTLICEGCGAVMPYERKSKRFCSTRCRMAHHRGQTVMAVTV